MGRKKNSSLIMFIHVKTKISLIRGSKDEHNGRNIGILNTEEKLRKMRESEFQYFAEFYEQIGLLFLYFSSFQLFGCKFRMKCIPTSSK